MHPQLVLVAVTLIKYRERVTNICCLIILTSLMFPLFVGLVSSGGNFGGPLLTPCNTTMLLIWKLILRI